MFLITHKLSIPITYTSVAYIGEMEYHLKVMLELYVLKKHCKFSIDVGVEREPLYSPRVIAGYGSWKTNRCTSL